MCLYAAANYSKYALMQTRRQQPPITIRSARAVELLKPHMAAGRSQAEVIEEALERLPPPTPVRDPFGPEAIAERMARIDALLAHLPRTPIGTMAAFDAEEYDEDGLPR